MKLITKQQARYIKYICQGELESYIKNEALAMMLECIATGIFDTEKGLEKFAAGLKSYFQISGYLDGDNTTALGNEIIEKKHVWDKLYGTFEIGTIQSGNSKYIIQHALYNGNFSLRNVETPNFPGEFLCGESHVRRIKLERNAKTTEEKSVEIECNYDFDANKSSYSVTVNNTKFAFAESKDSFCELNREDADTKAEQKLKNYGLLYQNCKVLLTRYDPQNLPLNNAIEDIFNTGTFDHRDDDVEIKNIRLSIEDPEIAKTVLLKYLEWNSQKRYCGKNEINRLISDFYTLFDECVTVSCGTAEIFGELISCTAKTNITAYLHLMACKDLEPSNQGKERSARATSLGGNQKTMKGVVKAIVGDRQNVISVSIANKYAATNAAISRALCLFADVLKSEYNATLYLYLNDANSNPKASKEINKSFYDKLKTHTNIKTVTVSANAFKEIHDRYYRVETKDAEYWVTTTNELNALRYDDDYIGGVPRDDIKISTRGQMLDFTIIPLNEEDIRSEVKELLGKK